MCQPAHSYDLRAKKFACTVLRFMMQMFILQFYPWKNETPCILILKSEQQSINSQNLFITDNVCGTNLIPKLTSKKELAH